jgi:phage gp29-like protein
MSAYSIKMTERWRSAYNPLRGLTMARVASMLEAGELGDYADLQWLYRKIEKRDATLRGVVRKLRAALLKLDWDIKIPSDLDPELLTLAEQQKATLRKEYDKIENLRKALGFLALAEFRGYAHLEKITDQSGSITRLEPIPQWHWCRDGLYGEWKFNEQATGGTSGEPVEMDRLIVREVDDPVDELAVIAFLRKSLSQKDWDGFVEVFGIPSIIAIMPPNVPEQDRDKYQEQMEAIVSDLRGTAPNGTDIKTVGDGVRGIQPFEAHLKYQDEQIVLAGTSGKLTMLSASTGMNSGQADAQGDTFDEIATSQAAEISEVFQEQFDKPLLKRLFPDQPVLAYFELAAKEQADVDAEFDRALKASQAGFKFDVAELSEKTGYKLTDAPITPPAAPSTFLGMNRAPAPAAPQTDEAFKLASRDTLASGLAADLAPLRDRISQLMDELDTDDGPTQQEALASLETELPELFKKIRAAGATDKALEDILTTASVNGLDAAMAKLSKIRPTSPANQK